MKKYLIRYKPFLMFLGKFLFTYLILILIYQSYLNQFNTKKQELDSFSHIVANQTEAVLLFFGANISSTASPNEPAVILNYNQHPIARIVEGCNAISVIILFISFIIAFSGTFKSTLLYLLGGSILIHILNVIRIALLCILMYLYPAQKHFLHGVFFPLFIYGVVFLLWLVWVNNFSKYAKKNIQS